MDVNQWRTLQLSLIPPIATSRDVSSPEKPGPCLRRSPDRAPLHLWSLTLRCAVSTRINQGISAKRSGDRKAGRRGQETTPIEDMVIYLIPSDPVCRTLH